MIEFNLVGSTWTPVTETWYIYDGMTVIEERSNKKIPAVHYTRVLDLSGSPGGAGGIGGLLTRSSGYNSSTGAWSTHDYYHADGSGNIAMLISNSSTPTIRAQYEYDPFGRIQTQSGSLASTNTQRFSSKEQIGNSPLSYYGYRFYHADVQRWMNRDPIEEDGGLNLYGFVSNSPVNYSDLLGLQMAGSAQLVRTPTLLMAPEEAAAYFAAQSAAAQVAARALAITAAGMGSCPPPKDPCERYRNIIKYFNDYYGNLRARVNNVIQEGGSQIDLHNVPGLIDELRRLLAEMYKAAADCFKNRDNTYNIERTRFLNGERSNGPGKFEGK